MAAVFADHTGTTRKSSDVASRKNSAVTRTAIGSRLQLDWDSLGRSSGGSTPVGTIADLLAVIRAQSSDSIEELRIIGHANGKFIAFAGTTLPDKIIFTENAMIGDSATFITARSGFRSVQDRFRADGRVVLAGCGSGGVGSDLLDLVSHTRCCALWPDLRNPFSTPSMGRPKDPS